MNVRKWILLGHPELESSSCRLDVWFAFAARRVLSMVPTIPVLIVTSQPPAARQRRSPIKMVLSLRRCLELIVPIHGLFGGYRSTPSMQRARQYVRCTGIPWCCSVAVPHPQRRRLEIDGMEWPSNNNNNNQHLTG